MNNALQAVRTFATVSAGWVLLLGGIALMPLPGPGVLISFAGIVVLSTRYAWARRLRRKAAAGVETATQQSVATKKRVFTAFLGALGAVGVGVVLIIDPRLPAFIDFTLLGIDVGPHIPGASIVSGVLAIAGGVVAIGVLIYARMAYVPDGEVESDVNEDLNHAGLIEEQDKRL